MTNKDKLTKALWELTQITKDRDLNDPLKWLCHQLSRKAFGYRTNFDLKSPNNRLKEPEWKLMSQGALVRVAVERKKATKESMKEAAAWVVRQISSEQAANLVDHPVELNAAKLIKWRDACRKGTWRLNGFNAIGEIEFSEGFKRGELGWKQIIATVVNPPPSERE